MPESLRCCSGLQRWLRRDGHDCPGGPVRLAADGRRLHADRARVQVRYWSGFFLYLIDGIVRTTVGVLLVLYPGSGAQALTLVLTFYFIVGGLFKTFGSIAHLILYGFAC